MVCAQGSLATKAHGRPVAWTFLKLTEKIEALVIRNVENLRWPTLQSLQAIFQRFASQYEHYISNVIRSSKSAVVRARDLRLDGEAAVGPGLAALTMGTDALQALLQDGARIDQADGTLRSHG